MGAGSAQDVDLVIVGGGPAGLSTALFFANSAPRLRDRIVVLERHRYPRDKICAGAVGARADRILASIGVRVDVPHVPIRGFSVRAGGQTMRMYKNDGILGRVVRRIEYDHMLAEQAKARGIRIVEGVKVDKVSMTSFGVHLSTSMGDIRARAVVGADGVGSIVRRSVGWPRGKFMAQVVEIDTAQHPVDGARDMIHFDLDDQSFPGYAWDFPTLVDGKQLVCRGIYDVRIEGRRLGSEESLSAADRLRLRNERMGVDTLGHSDRRFAERGVSLAEPLAKPGVLLVGEAAGIDPVLGEGIAQAIHYGAVAGPYLAKCFEQGDLSFSRWNQRIMSTRLGVDLLGRSTAARHVYGFTRPIIERWVMNSPAFFVAGMNLFSGEYIPRRTIARAAIDLGRAGIEWASRVVR